MKELKITCGYAALVDDEDFEELSKYNWQACPRGKTVYVKRYATVNGKETTVQMHRQILDAKKGEVIDHKNRNGLDNRRDNIRKVTRSQNQFNREVKHGTDSKYRGVKISNKGRTKNIRWQAYIKINYKTIHLGIHDTEIQAAQAFNRAVIVYKLDKFCPLNVIP